MTTFTYCEIVKRHTNAIIILNGHSLDELFKKAILNSGDQSTITSFDYDDVAIEFRQNGDILLTIEQVSVTSRFKTECFEEDLGTIVILISDNSIKLCV